MADTATAAVAGVRPAGREGGYSFGNGDTRSQPFMVSGELFLRSTQSLLFGGGGGGSRDPAAGPSSDGSKDTTAGAPAATSPHPSAALLARLSPDLRDLLLCQPDVHAASDDRSAAAAATGADADDGDGLRGLVSSARAERRVVRRKRVEYLRTSKTAAGCLAAARLGAVHRAGGGFRERCGRGDMQLDSRLRALVLRFAAAVSAEMAAEDAQTAAEGRHCRREMERLELAARLASLAATAEHRTRGSVVLRRLPPTHPQHARCLRAATENVRPGFFSSKSPYGAVRVLDIYKIENRVLLERFQRAAEATGPCKVKGLFCRVPDESLEHVVLYGMGGEGVLMDEEGAAPSSAAAGWDGEPIELCWGGRGDGATKGSAAGGGEGSAGERDATHGSSGGGGGGGSGGGGKRALEFPRAFSRHSTLEEEYGYANSRRGCDDVDEGGRDVRRHRRPCSSPPPPAAGATTGAKEEASPSPLPPPADSRPPPPRRRQQCGAGEGAAGDKQHGATPAVSGLRFLALCRVMIGSMHVATVPSPEAAAQRKDGGGGGDSGGGGGGGGSTSSHGSCSPRGGTAAKPPATERLQGDPSLSPGAVVDPGVLRPFALPSPPPGQAAFDSVYFPREEEYRLLNEALVLPEFLVVHRFVSATTPSGSGASGVTAANSVGAESSSSKGAEEGRQPEQVAAAVFGGVSTGGNGKGGGGAERAAAENRGERGQQRLQQHRQNGGRTKGESADRQTLLLPSAAAVVVSRDAASVVAEIEAGIAALPQGSNALVPRSGGGGGGSGDGSGSSAPCEAVVAPLSGGGDGNSPSSFRGGQVGAVDGSSDGVQGEGRGRQRGSGRAVRDSIVGEVVKEFERYWQEMEHLREVEKNEVAEAALSRRKLRHPP